MSEFKEDSEQYGLDDRCIVPWKDGSMYSGRVQKILDPARELLIEGVPTRKNGKQQINENTTPIKKIRQERSKRVPASVIDKCEESGEKWYYVHYFGWGNNFDEWLPLSRMLPYNPRYISEMKAVNAEIKERERLKREEGIREAKAKKNRKRGQSSVEPEPASAKKPASSEPVPSATPRKVESTRSNGSSRPSSTHGLSSKRRRVVMDDGHGFEIKLALPLDFKRLLVLDWRLVTRDRAIVELPRAISVVEILKDFAEAKNRHGDSGDKENMDLFVRSMTTYFDYCLGMMLLYRFERNHYYAQRHGDAHFRPSLVYGAEHLARLIVSMPTLLSQMATMDDVTMEYVVRQLEALSEFMTEHRNRYFAGESSYASATRAYEIVSIPNASADAPLSAPEKVSEDGDEN